MASEVEQLTAEARARLAAMLADPRYELIPLDDTAERAATLPAGATVTVTASPTRGMEATIDLAVELAASGYEVIPHLSARSLTDRAQLEEIVDRIEAAGISEAFVVGGDATDEGEFRDGLALLKALREVGHSFEAIGVPGYPEGHPSIANAALRKALDHKSRYASSVTSQMCFDDEALRSWLLAERRRGMSLPLYIGLPGVAPVRRLVAIAARIGVGDSARFLSSHSHLLGRLARPGGYAPDQLLVALGDLYVTPGADVAGFHVFTFNQIDTTERWRVEFLQELEAG